MREQLEKRLAELRAELESGQRALAELEQKQAALRDTMLRISGAIQVLEEELAPAPTDQPAASALNAQTSG
jgi:predicted nuclease with TOPRIM domain